MSKTIDEKVVEMRFDNKQFESYIQTSLSSIDKLKNSLNFSCETSIRLPMSDERMKKLR